MSEQRTNPVKSTLDCDHCGDVAIEVPRKWFFDGEGEKCMSCGMPGCVVVSGDSDHPDDNAVYWDDTQESGVYCERPDCDDCKEMRVEEGHG